MNHFNRMIFRLFVLFMLVAALSGCGAVDQTQKATLTIPDGAIISYLGPQGTYTEEAAQYFFGDAATFVPKDTVNDAITELTAGRADFAVIPQENTLGGTVTNYVDALIGEKSVYVVGEVILPISQTLMGIPGTKIEDVKIVYSHAQGLKQSETWRAEHMPNAATEEMGSTAAAASFVADSGDKTLAAIAAPGAAALYGLEVLSQNVQITDANKTRFYVLSSEEPPASGFTNAVFIVSCEANRIDDVIVEIHNAHLEFVTIHDRPAGTKLGAYNYIIEVENKSSITKQQTDKVSGMENVRFAGCFDVIEKKPS